MPKINHTVNQITKEIERNEIPNILKNRNKKNVYPFVISLGTINNSELGEIEGNIEPGNFTQYSRIFTGKDNTLETWEGSTTCVKPSDDADHLIKEFKKGKVDRLYFDEIQAGVMTTPLGDEADFAQQQAVLTIKGFAEGQVYNYKSLFKHYIMPWTGTNAFFEITSLITYQEKGSKKVILQEVVFSSVNDKLASSGQSVEQFLQLSAPGEGYAWPYELDDNEYELDQDLLFNQPITEIQIEIFSGALFTAPLIMGRRVSGGADLKINAPTFLFPHKLKSSKPSEVSKTTGGENNYYFINEARIETIAYYTDWKDSIRDNYDLTAKRNYEGVIETNYADVIATNSAETKTDVYDPIWIFQTGEKTIDTSAIPYFEEDTYTLPTSMNVPTAFMLGAMLFLDTVKLPISITETIIWSNKDIPIIGGFLNNIALGIDWGGKTETAKIKAKNIFGFIPCTFYDFSEASLSTGENQGRIPIDSFRNETNDEVSGLLGSNSISTIFNFSITDNVERDGETLNTKDLGQEGGWKFQGGETPSSPLLDAYSGFIIDYIGWNGMAKADYKITAYRSGVSLFQMKKQTRAKFTGSTREWVNGNKLSNWNEKTGETIDYPAEVLPKLPPAGGGYSNIEINVDETFVNKDEIDYNIAEEVSRETNGDISTVIFDWNGYNISTKEVSIDFGEQYGLTQWETVKLVYKTADISIIDGSFHLELGDNLIYNKKIDTAVLTVDMNDFNNDGENVVIKEITAGTTDEKLLETFTAIIIPGGSIISDNNYFDTQAMAKIEAKRVGTVLTFTFTFKSPSNVIATSGTGYFSLSNITNISNKMTIGSIKLEADIE